MTHERPAITTFDGRTTTIGRRNGSCANPCGNDFYIVTQLSPREGVDPYTHYLGFDGKWHSGCSDGWPTEKAAIEFATHERPASPHPEDLCCLCGGPNLVPWIIEGVCGALADAGDDVLCQREDGDYGASVRQVVEQRDAARETIARLERENAQRNREVLDLILRETNTTIEAAELAGGGPFDMLRRMIVERDELRETITRLTKEIEQAKATNGEWITPALNGAKQRAREAEHQLTAARETIARLTQEIEELNGPWCARSDKILGLIPSDMRQNSLGVVDCVKRLVDSWHELLTENHLFRHGHKQADATDCQSKLTTATARIKELEREIDRLKRQVWHLDESDDPTQMDAKAKETP